MLHLSASDRVRPLADALAEVLATPLANPMESEFVAIPTDGMLRWLQLELARSLGASGPGRSDGVSANIAFRFPGALRQAVLAADQADDHVDPWRVEQLVWAVLDVLHAGRGDERLGPLTTLPAGGTWFGRARRLADLFDRYSVRRPELIREWNENRDVDATGGKLEPHDRWQPHLWRLTRACIGEPSPPERFPALLEGLRAGTLQPDLPTRLAVFGITTLPGGAPFLELAEALAEQRELHLFLLDPSPAAVATVHDFARAQPVGTERLRAGDDSAEAVHHPLLRSWGRPYRERTVLLAAAEDRGVPAPVRLDDTSSHEADPPHRLLARIQADLRAGAVPAGDFELAADDHSIQVHSGHGPGRQVEVLRDAILHLLADDPTLREEDIVVLTPSIEEFAPWVESGFGTSADSSPGAGPSGRPRLAYRIADRSLRESYPLLAALDTLLELVAGRFTASAVLEFLALAPVRTRFDLDDDAIAVIGHWIAETNVRWGRDGEHRAPWGVPAACTANSWRAALDRLLMGVAVSEDDWALAAGEIAPLGVEGSDIAVAGRLADVLAHLATIADDMERPRTTAEWCATLLDASGRLFAVEPKQQSQLDRLRQIITDIADGATVGERASAVELTLADVRRLLSEHFRGAPRRPDFFRGGITVSSLRPLRWVPFRVVCLLGLDENALTTTSVDGDDLGALAPRLGDRDPRAEQRQWLLEAVLAAQDHLVITRTSHNILTNQDVPESVAFAELRDTITATLAGNAPHTFTTRIETIHPHQPFDARCFVPGALREGPWSFDATALEGAVARARREDEAEPFLANPLADPPDQTHVITLAELQSFLKHPVKCFFARRLRVHLPREEGGLSDHLPITISGLEQWSAAQRLIEARLDGRTSEQWARHERALGTLPAGGYGEASLTAITAAVDALLAVTTELGVDPRHDNPQAIDVELPDGTRIVGAVGRHCQSDLPGPARLTYSKAQAKQHLESWLDLMALVAQDPDESWRSVHVRRDRNGGKHPDPLELVPRGATSDQRRADALAALTVVVDLYRRGLKEPIPLFTKLSRKLFDHEAKAGDWINQSGFAEGGEDSHVLAFGALELRDLRAIEARPHDPAGTRPGRADRFADYLWGAVEGFARIREPEPADADPGPDRGAATSDAPAVVAEVAR
jgi:exodeoxyribonuclease V gamma subunit